MISVNPSCGYPINKPAKSKGRRCKWGPEPSPCIIPREDKVASLVHTWGPVVRNEHAGIQLSDGWQWRIQRCSPYANPREPQKQRKADAVVCGLIFEHCRRLTFVMGALTFTFVLFSYSFSCQIRSLFTIFHNHHAKHFNANAGF